MRPARLVSALAALALVAAACGSDGGGAGEPLASEAGRVTPPADAPRAEVAASLNNIGFALFETLPADESTVLSPSSIGHAVLMARGAADSDTGVAIDEALGLPAGVRAHDGWNAIDQALAAAAEEQTELTISLADRIWPRLDVEPDQEWVEIVYGHMRWEYKGDPGASEDEYNWREQA